MGEEEPTQEEYFKNLEKQLGRDLGQCLPGNTRGTKEERHETAVRLVDDFLELGGSPNAVDEDDMPILTTAVHYDCLPLVKLLLDHGADVNVENSTHYAAGDLLYAFLMGTGKNMELLDIILRAGANLDGVFNHGAAKEWFGTAEEWLESPETSINPLQGKKILERIRHERRRRVVIQKVNAFKEVTKPHAAGIPASVLREDHVNDIVNRVMNRL